MFSVTPAPVSTTSRHQTSECVSSTCKDCPGRSHDLNTTEIKKLIQFLVRSCPSVHWAWLLGGMGVLMGERMGEAGTPPDSDPPAPAPVGDPELMLECLPWSLTTGWK